MVTALVAATHLYLAVRLVAALQQTTVNLREVQVALCVLFGPEPLAHSQILKLAICKEITHGVIHSN
jgi:hypothetical protein